MLFPHFLLSDFEANTFFCQEKFRVRSFIAASIWFYSKCHILNGELDSSVVKFLNSSLFFTKFASFLLSLPFYSVLWILWIPVLNLYVCLCVCIISCLFLVQVLYFEFVSYARHSVVPCSYPDQFSCCFRKDVWRWYYEIWIGWCIAFIINQISIITEYNQIVCSLIQLQTSTLRVLYPTSETPHRTRVHCWHEQRREVIESIVGGISNDDQQYISQENICVFLSQINPHSMECA